MNVETVTHGRVRCSVVAVSVVAVVVVVVVVMEVVKHNFDARHWPP